jgi:hypothetical protein
MWTFTVHGGLERPSKQNSQNAYNFFYLSKLLKIEVKHYPGSLQLIMPHSPYNRYNTGIKDVNFLQLFNLFLDENEMNFHEL